MFSACLAEGMNKDFRFSIGDGIDAMKVKPLRGLLAVPRLPHSDLSLVFCIANFQSVFDFVDRDHVRACLAGPARRKPTCLWR